MFNTTGSLLQSVRSGQVRGLGVTSAQRYALAPELPTFSESGVAGFDVTGWYALFTPARTPREIIDKIQADTVAMLAEPGVKARYEPLGIAPNGSTPDELARLMQAEVELWGPVIKAGNIKGE
jgi:tripartite-type tricarboxylate transporter receptor subunit TctC